MGFTEPAHALRPRAATAGRPADDDGAGTRVAPHMQQEGSAWLGRSLVSGRRDSKTATSQRAGTTRAESGRGEQRSHEPSRPGRVRNVRAAGGGVRTTQTTAAGA